MLAFFRAMSKSKIFWVILGVPLVAGLLIFGNVTDVFSGVTGKDAVVSVGDRTVSSAEFQQVFNRAKKAAEERAGRPITTEEAVAQGAIDGLLRELASNEALLAALDKAGVRPSDTLLLNKIRAVQAFFNPVTGRFDQDVYKQTLAGEGLTAEQFEASVRDELASEHFRYGLAGGLKAPMVYAALAATAELEQRTFAAFFIDPASIPAPAPPNDAQLQAFMKANAAELTLPERRSLTVVRFSARALEPTVTVDPAEVRKRYDFRKDTLATPERRTVVQVPARDAAAASAVAARLDKGEDPAAVAKSLGVEPVVYRDVPRTGVSDPRLAEAAFRLAPGAVAPVQGGLGWAALKVISVTPGQTVAFEQARPAIEAELRALVAEERADGLMQKYDDAVSGGSTLKEAARAAGVTALELPPVTARGVNQQGQPQPMLSPKLLEQAFQLPEGGESEIVLDGKGEHFVVRVDKVFPAAVPPLSEARAEITQVYMARKRMEALRAKLDGLAERVRKGETMDAAAASVGARVDRMTLDLRTAEQAQGERREILAAVFSGKPGAVLQAGPGLIKIETVAPGSVQRAAIMTRTSEQNLRMSVFQDLTSEASRWARTSFKVKTDPKRARAALGLPPEEDAAAGKGASK